VNSDGTGGVKSLARKQAPAVQSQERGVAQAAAPTFFVRDVPVFGDVVLAPMAGFADVPTRAICRRFGSAMNYSEFVAAEDIIHGSSRAKSLLDFTIDDRPLVFQIFGNDARRILLAAQKIEELGPDIIDINMGCSTRRVSGRGAGVGMMRDPALVAETFALLSKHLSVPVTGKIRLGWEDKQNYLVVARILEDNGAALIALHPRTKEQGYRGVAQWEAIAAATTTPSRVRPMARPTPTIASAYTAVISSECVYTPCVTSSRGAMSGRRSALSTPAKTLSMNPTSTA